MQQITAPNSEMTNHPPPTTTVRTRNISNLPVSTWHLVCYNCRQGFPRDLSWFETTAGFHGIRDNPVITVINCLNPVPVRTDTVEVFAIPIPSRLLFSYRFRTQLCTCLMNLCESREIKMRVSSHNNMQTREIWDYFSKFKSHSN